MLKTENLTKDFGNGRGIFDVNLDIEKGRVYGLLGPNGAGKTTLIRILLSFVKPDAGVAFVNGLSVFADAEKIHGSLGYLPAEIALPDGASGRELIKEVTNLWHPIIPTRA